MTKKLALIFLSFLVSFAAQAGIKATSIVVMKSERKLYVFNHDGLLIKKYDVALGFDPEGPKLQYGDGKTPEGVYKVIEKRKPNQFHLALKINYPNAEDLKRSHEAGVPAGHEGDEILIHGVPNYIKIKYLNYVINTGNAPEWLRNELSKYEYLIDWTAGCVAVSNSDIEEIFSMTDMGTKITIRP